MRKKRYKSGELINNRFLVHSRLRGGMGEVYFCTDQETNQPIALKTPWWAEDVSAERVKYHVERFLREARTWVSLGQHPNIVRCYYLDMFEQQPFLFLEWITAPERSRTSLHHLFKETGPLSLEQALDITLGICHGLKHAATVQPGLVHRDLKPGNILIAQDMTARISDFGLARAWDGLGKRKRGAVGTPAYRPPEQWQHSDVDVRSDIYAVGLILYECLLAQRPFAGDTDQEWYNVHLNEPPPHLPDEFPADVDAIVQRCLVKDVEGRYQSIDELLAALGQVIRSNLEHEPAPAPVAGELTAGDFVNKGNTFVHIKRYEDSLRAYSHALELDPDAATALENRGALYWMLERPDAALADLNRSIQINPRSHSAFYNRAVIQTGRGKMVRALQDYNSALSLAPGHISAYFNRGILLRDLGQHEQALVDFTRAIRLSPTAFDAFHNRGLTLLELLDYQAALDDFSKALELSPGSSATLFNRGVTYQILGRYEEALADFNAAIEANPDFRQAWEQRATIHHHMGAFDEALTDYTRAIMIGPEERVELYYNRGLVLIEMGEYEAAILNFDHAIAVDRHFLPVHVARARALLLNGQKQEAHGVAEALLLVGFDSVGLHQQLEVLFTELGDEEMAARAHAIAAELQQKRTEAASNSAGDASTNGYGNTHDNAQGALAGADGTDESMDARVAALEAFHAARTPEQIEQLVATYPFATDPAFVSAAEQSLTQREAQDKSGSRRQKIAGEARLLWLRHYARYSSAK